MPPAVAEFPAAGLRVEPPLTAAVAVRPPLPEALGEGDGVGEGSGVREGDCVPQSEGGALPVGSAGEGVELPLWVPSPRLGEAQTVAGAVPNALPLPPVLPLGQPEGEGEPAPLGEGAPLPEGAAEGVPPRVNRGDWEGDPEGEGAPVGESEAAGEADAAGELEAE